MSHPYRHLPDHHFWSRAVANPALHELDPAIGTTLKVTPDLQIGTMGSCFAQHLARHLRLAGMTYLIAEPAPGALDPSEARRRNFGVFSARYGNVYTVRQALQLFDRAFGTFQPDEPAWRRGDAWVDPFRPQIEPDGFPSITALEADRQAHLEATRRVFTESGLFVFTLGLTEGWCSTSDGAVLPLAPGVAGGTFDPSRHRFVNFGIADVIQDLAALIERVHEVNPSVQVLLTISPVPLMATYEARHVLVSTIYSKSVLRVAADEVAVAFPFVHYFPSYEIITAPGLAERYFADDLRSVTEEGVAHVMRMFMRHCVPNAARHLVPAALAAELDALAEIVCDEEALASPPKP